ncbi:uncharacterized protein N7479_000995 [Penicillium vulpinum]|uniref:Hpc2-related domain-containing protein n=1 Tax=Penicillium vulpinum TaxID=29845 RepID=A0A1V6RGK3_9EURO|nr:uncharacterized protein N7479_000995 [Penicillium vulpinum]KAJ5971077.1 hypothetical protein N7479_000995 [Penicillium vulpinum]OQE00756.1 hypothetical protein PENVUL_c046G00660 [Penicillium vulpinum]
MSDPPNNMELPKEQGPIDTDVKPGTGARRASGTARRSRRKKDDDPDTKKDKEPKEAKEKPARAPRRPREKSNNTASRKKPKLEPAAEETRAPPVDARSPPHAPTAPQPAQPAQSQLTQIAQPQPPQSQPATTSYSNPHPHTAPGASYQLSQPSRPQSQSQPPLPQPPPQRTSGQNFDPIRSAFDNPSPAPSYSPPARAISPRNTYRASASPAISSIIDPPNQNSQQIYNLQRSSSHVSGLSSPAPPAMVPAPSHPSLAPSPLPISSTSRGAIQIPQAMSQSTPYTTPYPPTEQRPTPSETPKLEPSPPAMRQPQPPAQPESAVQPSPPRQQPAESMEIDPKEQHAPGAKKEKSTATAPASKASSPKPARPAKEAPHLPQGSSLITNALFGGGEDSAKSPDSRSTPNIIVHVPLQKGNQIVNFARLAEEQYGFAALHPRLAAHKARMARVAAAGAALERNDKNAKGISAGESADEDLSLDAERDSDMDGDLPMGGTGAGTNGAPSETSDGKKKRRKKVEEYDRDDPFVDDTEMVWQEQAAASKDGFFVYSGPLIPEGEKVQVERADGTIKRGRGRGRGTGRGRTVTSHPHVPIAAAVPVSQDTGLPLRGPGSRGGTSRRPRGNKKTDGGSDRAAATASAAHESRGGRGGGNVTSGRGGTNSTRGGKSSISIPMPDLAPAPSTPSVAHTPSSSSQLAGPELMMK